MHGNTVFLGVCVILLHTARRITRGRHAKPVGYWVSMSAKGFMPRYFVQVSVNEMEAGTCLDGPSDEEVRADALEYHSS